MLICNLEVFLSFSTWSKFNHQDNKSFIFNRVNDPPLSNSDPQQVLYPFNFLLPFGLGLFARSFIESSISRIKFFGQLFDDLLNVVVN